MNESKRKQNSLVCCQTCAGQGKEQQDGGVRRINHCCALDVTYLLRCLTKLIASVGNSVKHSCVQWENHLSLFTQHQQRHPRHREETGWICVGWVCYIVVSFHHLKSTSWPCRAVYWPTEQLHKDSNSALDVPFLFSSISCSYKLPFYKDKTTTLFGS